MDEYNVEKIMDKTVIEGQPYYLIKWAGYPEEENTWEPLTNLYCTNLVEDFERTLQLKNTYSIFNINESDFLPSFDKSYTSSSNQTNDEDDTNGNQENTSTSGNDTTTENDKSDDNSDDDCTGDDEDDATVDGSGSGSGSGDDDSIDDKNSSKNTVDNDKMAKNLKDLQKFPNLATGNDNTVDGSGDDDSIVDKNGSKNTVDNDKLAKSFKNLRKFPIFPTESPLNFIESYVANMQMISPIESIRGDYLPTTPLCVNYTDKVECNDVEKNNDKSSRYFSNQSAGALNSPLDSSNSTQNKLLINEPDLLELSTTIATSTEDSPTQLVIIESAPEKLMCADNQITHGTPSDDALEGNENGFVSKVKDSAMNLSSASSARSFTSSSFEKPNEQINNSPDAPSTDSPKRTAATAEDEDANHSRSEETSHLLNGTTTIDEDIETDLSLPEVTSSIYSPIHSQISSLESSEGENDYDMNTKIINDEMLFNESSSIKNAKTKDILKKISSSPIYSPPSSLTSSLDWEEPEDLTPRTERTYLYGYQRGLKLRKIETLVEFDKVIYYIVYWHGLEDPDVVKGTEICHQNPQETLKFLENHSKHLTNPSEQHIRNIIRNNKYNILGYKSSKNTPNKNDQQESTNKHSMREKRHICRRIKRRR